MNKHLTTGTLIAVIAAALAWTGHRLSAARPPRPVTGLFHRSKVDGSGHSRGVVQVDLMRRIMAERTRADSSSSRAESGGTRDRLVPSQGHRLLGREAPAFVLGDVRGGNRTLGDQRAKGPVVLVFYLGVTCVACVTHLVELDGAAPQFRDRGARVLAISPDSLKLSRERIRKFGGLELPLLSDPDHKVGSAYGVWKPFPDGDANEGETLHGTFLIDSRGTICWAYVGARPFRDIKALLAEVDRIDDRRVERACGKRGHGTINRRAGVMGHRRVP